MLAEDAELLGRSEGSGYIDEHHLARTGSSRIVRLTDLLFSPRPSASASASASATR